MQTKTIVQKLANLAARVAPASDYTPHEKNLLVRRIQTVSTTHHETV